LEAPDLVVIDTIGPVFQEAIQVLFVFVNLSACHTVFFRKLRKENVRKLQQQVTIQAFKLVIAQQVSDSVDCLVKVLS